MSIYEAFGGNDLTKNAGDLNFIVLPSKAEVLAHPGNFTNLPSSITLWSTVEYLILGFKQCGKQSGHLAEFHSHNSLVCIWILLYIYTKLLWKDLWRFRVASTLSMLFHIYEKKDLRRLISWQSVWFIRILNHRLQCHCAIWKVEQHFRIPFKNVGHYMPLREKSSDL